MNLARPVEWDRRRGNWTSRAILVLVLQGTTTDGDEEVELLQSLPW